MKELIENINKLKIQGSKVVHDDLSTDKWDKLLELLDLDSKELYPEKHPNDYNFDEMSTVLSKAALFLSEYGIKKYPRGFVVELLSLMESVFDQDVNYIIHEYLKENDKNYFYIKEYSEEIMTNFLLKTESGDKRTQLLKDCYSSLGSFIKKEDIDKIKKALTNAKKRWAKEDLFIYNPLLSQSKNEKIDKFDLEDELLPSSLENNDFFIEKKKRSIDLVSLKELNNILKGDYCSEYSIGLGFFASFIFELNKQGIDSIIFKIKDNLLSEIKVVNLKEVNNFSPIKSAQMLLDSYGKISNEEYQNPLKKEKEIYQVLVSGLISVPLEKKAQIDYSHVKSVRSVESAGEVFLFNKKNKYDVCSRIYFVPREYKNIHSYFHNNLVIIGGNDCSFQSCSDQKAYLIDKEDYVDFIKGQDFFSEAMLFKAINLNLPIMNLFHGKNHNEFNDVINSKSGFDVYTQIFNLNKLQSLSWKYDEKYVDIVNQLTEFYLPITKRFNLNKYIKNEMPQIYAVDTFVDSINDGLRNKLELESILRDIANENKSSKH